MSLWFEVVVVALLAFIAVQLHWIEEKITAIGRQLDKIRLGLH
jgi:hypothetical protein